MKSTKSTKSTTMTKYSAIPYVLLVGSVVASLVGAKLLAWQERPTPVTIQPLSLPAEMAQGSNRGGFVLELEAIPTVVPASSMPLRPVARSRSSR
jgi:hypothetical protein